VSDAVARIAVELGGAAGNGRADPDQPSLLPPPTEPLAVARELLAAKFTTADGPLTLRHWRGGWWRWHTSHWGEVEDRAVRGAVYRFTEHGYWISAKDAMVAWAPTRNRVADVIDAMASVCFLPEDTHQPTWIDGASHPGGVIVACANGLLDVATRQLAPHDPRYFNVVAVPFPYDPDAGDPVRWFEFLDDLFADDPEAVAALQEWFGYVVSGRTALQKILLVVGPPRSGKGTLSRVLGALVGRGNVAGPTLSSLGDGFGLAPLIGKSLAVVSDARLTGRGTSTVVERLLAISGEDAITVDRKYRDQWTGPLPARFVILSNELPAFTDASTAIVSRFVVLQLERSFLDIEDPDLEPALHAELGPILTWALDGLDRLGRQGRFTAPPSSRDAVATLIDLASPVRAFLRDRCTVDPNAETPCDEVYRAWKVWQDDNGHIPLSTQELGKNLRALLPGVRIAQPRTGSGRIRSYRGIALRRLGQ
jgi:putative DNA primase/helicase